MKKEICFDKELYKKEAITQAIEDFKGFFEASIKEKKTKYVVDLFLKNTQPKVIEEFCNHIIAIIKTT